ncbi:MAG: AmmeMemoRadiSam system radical SAM enzyme [Syntrophobacteraceae bacterium]|jgi:pyruvate formate lyase activating enzyme|nr:AmmeMemoRadiSam system radical SAM enzyme [Syntrophobacteraceae bacterium]
MKEAMLYRRLESETVECFLCAQRCTIKPGKRGRCAVRQNDGGILHSLVYDQLIAQHVDPIEKKPLFHFRPGSRSYSIATAGCNFRCLFCQNADISQLPREQHLIPGRRVPAADVVGEASRSGCTTISYTYTEPTVFMEYALDVARIARGAGMGNVFVSNGYMTAEAMEVLAPLLDAANIDLKAFSDEFYREQCGAHLQPVLDTLRLMKGCGIWVEVTTLLIPGLNDDPGELRQLARYLVSLGPEIPWHVSRFHPTYRLLDRRPTPVETLRMARRIGLEEGLHYVYTGNVPGDEGESTYCHSCGEVLIERFGFSTRFRGVENGVCIGCGMAMAGVGIP